MLLSDAPNTACSLASAILTTVVSRMDMNTPNTTAITTSHLYSSPNGRRSAAAGGRDAGAGASVGGRVCALLIAGPLSDTFGRRGDAVMILAPFARLWPRGR